MKTARQSLHVVVCSLKWGQPVEGQIAIEATTKLQWGQRVWGRPVDAQPSGRGNGTQQWTHSMAVVTTGWLKKVHSRYAHVLSWHCS